MKDTTHLQALRFPIGEFKKPEVMSPAHIAEWITEIELFPERLCHLVATLTGIELDWRYRPGGWTIQQVVHHCADSHMNSFIRFKLALTEDTPAIKPYSEAQWAELPDTTEAPVSESLKIIEGLHARWARLLRAFNANDLKREFIHPEQGKRFSLAENIGIYAWHCNHHLAHIRQALENKGL